MPGTRSRNEAEDNGNDSASDGPQTYESIMGSGGASALTNRLIDFRKWAKDEAQINVHPSVCIVNGEATDGTRNAPVLAFGPPPGSAAVQQTGIGRIGIIDQQEDRALYEKTIGCQVRT